ncbi:MAG: exo-alpha-sialidase [Planctomycetes bacterium]|nr:exo-alpha-sialidase [Planctomycetota bacterium]
MKHVKLVVFVLIGCVLRAGGMARSDDSVDRIVTVRAADGLIQIVDAKGQVEKSFGRNVGQSVLGATVQSPNFRVAVGDVLGAGSPQIITAVADQLDPCRRLFDPHGGKPIDLRWSREGRFALDVAVSRSGALTINEKRDADGRPVSSYWNCYNVGANERLFHTEFGVEVVAIDAGELDSTIAGDEVATINRDGRIQVWDSAKKAHDPIVLFRIDAERRHVDLTISDVNEQSPGNEIVASDAEGRLRIYSAVGKMLQVVSLDARISRVAAGNVSGRPGREILAVDRKSGDVLVVSRGEVVSRIKASSGKPFVDVATIGAVKPLRTAERQLATRFNPVNDIRRGNAGDVSWRVDTLTFANGGEGLFRAYNCLFTIANYWDYAVFSSQSRCELPGKRFVARASGNVGDSHHFLSPSFWGTVNRYRMVDGRFYIAWRTRAPDKFIEGGRFSDVTPSAGPWEVWCNAAEGGKTTWSIRSLRDGKWAEERVTVEPGKAEWMNVQLIAESRQLILQVNQKEQLRVTHDAYREPFDLRFGSRQTKVGGAEVVSRFREVYVSERPYPWPGEQFAEGPEDVHSEDGALVGYLLKATPQSPRSSEGDMILTKEGHLLAVYSYYYDGKGHDGSPARLVASLSKDGGRTWSPNWTVADRDKGSQGNVMSASLLRASNGDLLMTYYDRTPKMPAKGMVLRRSADEGKTWSQRVVVTPGNGNRHVANNACLTRLSSRRIILATREYVGGIRWPYACYSDDDGRTWNAGRHVPDPGLTPRQKRGQNVNEPSICELADGRLLMTMRSIAGGQFFSWSRDAGETWTKPILSPLRGECSPAIVRRIPGTDDILAVWTYGYGGRAPLVSAISSDGGQTWKHLKLLEQSRYHGYCYASCIFQGDRVHLSYMHFPMFSSRFRFEADPGYIDYRFVSLPLAWFYRDPGDS